MRNPFRKPKKNKELDELRKEIKVVEARNEAVVELVLRMWRIIEMLLRMENIQPEQIAKLKEYVIKGITKDQLMRYLEKKYPLTV